MQTAEPTDLSAEGGREAKAQKKPLTFCKRLNDFVDVGSKLFCKLFVGFFDFYFYILTYIKHS